MKLPSKITHALLKAFVSLSTIGLNKLHLLSPSLSSNYIDSKIYLDYSFSLI